MALSSWNALYTKVEQKFMKRRQWRQLHLLKVFVQHADPFGLSYPGEDLIKELTGIGTTAQINENLLFLTDGEYIKLWDTWNPRHRVYETDYQVSPWMMYIREEYQGYCEHVWRTGERDYGLENAIVIKLNGQPTSEPESEPTSFNQHQNQHHQPPNIAAKQQGLPLADDDYETQVPEPPKQRQRRRATGTGRSTEKENPQARGPVPDKIDFRKYRSALPRPDDEDRAQDLHTVLRVKLLQARGLVANFGRDQVEVAARAVKDAMDKGQCLNPPGLLTYLLKKGGSSSDDKKLYPTPAEKMAAENERLAYQDNDTEV